MVSLLPLSPQHQGLWALNSHFLLMCTSADQTPSHLQTPQLHSRSSPTTLPHITGISVDSPMYLEYDIQSMLNKIKHDLVLSQNSEGSHTQRSPECCFEALPTFPLNFVSVLATQNQRGAGTSSPALGRFHMCLFNLQDLGERKATMAGLNVYQLACIPTWHWNLVTST